MECRSTCCVVLELLAVRVVVVMMMTVVVVVAKSRARALVSSPPELFSPSFIPLTTSGLMPIAPSLASLLGHIDSDILLLRSGCDI